MKDFVGFDFKILVNIKVKWRERESWETVAVVTIKKEEDLLAVTCVNVLWTFHWFFVGFALLDSFFTGTFEYLIYVIC